MVEERRIWTATIGNYAGGQCFAYCRQCGSVWLHPDNLKADHNVAHPERPVTHGRQVGQCVQCGTAF